MLETSVIIKTFVIGIFIVTFFKIIYFNYLKNERISIRTFTLGFIMYVLYILFPIIFYFYVKDKRCKDKKELIKKMENKSKEKKDAERKLRRYENNTDIKLVFSIFKYFALNFEMILKDLSAYSIEKEEKIYSKNRVKEKVNVGVYRVINESFHSESELYCLI